MVTTHIPEGEIEEFYLKHKSFITYLLGIFGADTTQKDDLVHKIIYRIIANYKSIECDQQRRAWISTITKSVYMDYLTKSRIEAPLDFHIGQKDPDSLPAIKALLTGETNSQIDECFRELSTEQQELIKLKFDENLTWKKVGERFELKEDTARKRAGSALSKLQKCFEEGNI